MFRFRSRCFGSLTKVARIHHEVWRVQLSLEHLEERLAVAAFTVTALTDNGPANGQLGGVGAGLTGDLRNCMTQAGTIVGSTIGFQAGLTGTVFLSNTPLPEIVANTTISAPAGRVITVQGTTNQQNPYSVFKTANGATVEIDNLQITGGTATQNGGGGVQNLGTLTLKNDVIKDNFAIGAGQTGGGIYNGVGASLTLTDDTIAFNEALKGGGIANYGSISGNGNTIDSNQASAPVGGDGGGIFNGTDAIFEMYSATISNNTAEGNGGGVYNLGEFTIHGGSISTNDAGSNQYGGGVYSGNGGTVTLDEGLVLDDNGAFKGAGLYLQFGSTTILDSVFIQNNRLQMGGQGRGIYEQNGANLTETTVTDADDPGGVPVQGS